ncbi:MAG TPA: hypothetical protein VNA65_06745 [Candidatus Dormibacteraeota bacterium]|nr:hypothetical protein [Candidatus Dormibacteraeota bacterium]
MVRHRIHLHAALGKYKDAITWVAEMNQARQKLGLPDWKPWAPIDGDFNYLILEADYADLAAYDAGEQKFQSDPQTMNLFRRGNDWGSPAHWPTDEVLVSAPTIS